MDGLEQGKRGLLWGRAPHYLLVRGSLSEVSLTGFHRRWHLEWGGLLPGEVS